MSARRRLVSRASAFVSMMLCSALLASAVASPAMGVTLVTPADTLDRTDVKASLTASDPAGFAVLYLDGAAIRSVVTSAGPRTVPFTAIPLAAGSHRFKLVVRSAGGLWESPARTVTSWRKPIPPVLISPVGGYAGKNTTIVAKAGPGTTSLKLILNGRTVATKPASPGQVVSLGSVGLAAGINTIQIQAANPVASTTGSFKVHRLDYPWPTCVIIDKSEFRLYWIRDGYLVKTYPVAIGKPSTPTPSRNWRIDAKYITDWGSVYGPRKMRLFKQVGASSFEYSAYGIHGTNEEWVIGTMASHGCIRMYNRDILELYPQVPLGTMAQTRD